MSKFRIYRDNAGVIRISERGILFESKVYQSEGYKREYYISSVEDAERTILRIISERNRRKENVTTARAERGLVYEFDTKHDDRYSNGLAFRVYHNGRTDSSYYLNEKTWAGWVRVYKKIDGKRYLHRFDSLNEIKSWIIEHSDARESKIRRQKSAKTLKIIDSRLLDKGLAVETR